MGADQARHDRAIFFAMGAVAVCFAVANRTLIFDDLFFVEFFRALRHEPIGGALLRVFLSTDLQGEYRLYGLSKIVHLLLFWVIDARPWAWSALIAGSQALAGYGLYRLLVQLAIDRTIALLLAAVWIFSPFAATACFHHYSYLILPWQLIIAGALVIQRLQITDHPWLWRALLGALGFGLASTGEMHLLAAPLALAGVARLTPSTRSGDARVLDVIIPAGAMTVTLLLNRLAWLAAVPAGGAQRYLFALPPNLDQAQWRVTTFLASLPLGLSEQVREVMTFTWLAPAATALGIVAAIVAARYWRRPIAPCPIALPVALLALAAAAVLIVFLLSFFTGQVSVVYPRRYGYVPYTLFAMAAVALVASRRRLFVPAAATAGVFASLWFALEAVDLPIVRAQDGRIYAELAPALAQRPNVLIATAWRETVAPGQPLSIMTPGLRSLDFPEIFESPTAVYWWLGHQVMVMLGASFVGDHIERESQGVRLFGNNMGRPPSILVPPRSVVALADHDPRPPRWTDDLSARISVEPLETMPTPPSSPASEIRR
jgi:hypothetical protein